MKAPARTGGRRAPSGAAFQARAKNTGFDWNARAQLLI
jgi:hypothetical protein